MMNIFLENINIDNTFKPFFDKDDIKKMLFDIEDRLLEGEKYKNQFYPYPKDVLRFATLDLSNVKCIILGMDPYPSDFIKDEMVIPVSTGRSFEVKNLLSWQDNFKQSSLQNILKAIYYDAVYKNGAHTMRSMQNIDCKCNVQINNMHDVQCDKILQVSISDIRKDIRYGKFKILEPPLLWDNLEKQGVMWLNATLTVRPHESNTHTSLWKVFMDELIRYIVEYKKVNNEKNIKWLVWGENAKNRIEGLVDKKDMIYTCHPASRVNNTFVKDNCFQYVKEIQWNGI